MNFYNPYIAIPFTTWFLAQVIKFGLSALRGQLNLRLFYTSGGMPSAHSAVVIALAMTALVIEGVGSPIFGLATVFAAIVLYDSFGVRRSSGDQAVAINSILKRLPSSQDLGAIHLREVFGHRPDEVVAGAGLGAAVSLALTAGYWQNDIELLVSMPSTWERWFYLAIFGLMLAGGLVVRLVIGPRRFKSTPTLRSVRRFVATFLSSFGIVGLLISLAQFQSAEPLAWRFWAWLLLAGFATASVVVWLKWLRFVPSRYRAELARRKSHHKK